MAKEGKQDGLAINGQNEWSMQMNSLEKWKKEGIWHDNGQISVFKRW